MIAGLFGFRVYCLPLALLILQDILAAAAAGMHVHGLTRWCSIHIQNQIDLDVVFP